MNQKSKVCLYLETEGVSFAIFINYSRYFHKRLVTIRGVCVNGCLMILLDIILLFALSKIFTSS